MSAHFQLDIYVKEGTHDIENDSKFWCFPFFFFFFFFCHCLFLSYFLSFIYDIYSLESFSVKSSTVKKKKLGFFFI